jgi:hypothetical protein
LRPEPLGAEPLSANLHVRAIKGRRGAFSRIGRRRKQQQQGRATTGAGADPIRHEMPILSKISYLRIYSGFISIERIFNGECGRLEGRGQRAFPQGQLR